MSDWVDDIVDEINASIDVGNAERHVLAELLDTAYLTPEVKSMYQLEIYASEMDIDRWLELRNILRFSQAPVRDQYAPSQRSLSKWLRQFC